MYLSTAITSILRQLPAEAAHAVALTLLRGPARPLVLPQQYPQLSSTVWGIRFSSPIGIAAGFDKNAIALNGLTRLGAGFVEIGTVTPQPQVGNAKPRIFRLREDHAIINRIGFSGAGLDKIVSKLQTWRNVPQADACPIGVNIGANRRSSDVLGDYIAGLRRTAALADYITVNVSSPNTPGLRGWQKGDNLHRLLNAIDDTSSELGSCPPILIKLAPDLDDETLVDFVEAIKDAPISGLILTNTTTDRPPTLRSRHKAETGGLSGPPLADRSLTILRNVYSMTNGRVPLIGVGGIDSAEAAYARIRAGASLLQLYTALIYRGPRIIQEITTGLASRLITDGFSTLNDAVGVDNLDEKKFNATSPL